MPREVWTPGALLTLAAMNAMAESPEFPTQAFLKEFNIKVESASGDTTHPQRVHLDATPIDEAFSTPPCNRDLLCSPPDTGIWGLKGNCSVHEWATYLVQRAHSYLGHVSILATTPIVKVHVPREEDRWEKVLMRPPWETYGWRVQNIISVGEDEFRDVVGCVVPIRQQQEPAVTVYRGELFCALLLLNRQLRQFPVPSSYVTIIATTESRIRIHEAHIDEASMDLPNSTIRMVKRIDVGIADIVGKEPTLPEAWRDIMSYVCFTQQDRWLHVQPIRIRYAPVSDGWRIKQQRKSRIPRLKALLALESRIVESQPDAAEMPPGETTGTAPDQMASMATDTSISTASDKTISTVLNETASADSDGISSTALDETISTASDKATSTAWDKVISTTPDKTASMPLSEITSTPPRRTTSMTPGETPTLDVAKTTNTASCNAIVRTSRPPLAEMNVQTNATNSALRRVNGSPRKSPRKNGSSK